MCLESKEMAGVSSFAKRDSGWVGEAEYAVGVLRVLRTFAGSISAGEVCRITLVVPSIPRRPIHVGGGTIRVEDLGEVGRALERGLGLDIHHGGRYNDGLVGDRPGQGVR